jgi:putative transposase
MKYKSNTNIVYSCKYHVIWCSKYRRKVLIDGIEDKLKEIVQQLSKEKEAEVIELEIMPDHIHLLIRTRLPTLWTNSYFVSTVGGAPLSIIKCIKNQKHV